MIKYYSIGCPQCNQIKALMDNKKIEYEYITDIDIIMDIADKHGITSAPFAEINGEFLYATKLTKHLQTL